jgi:hypothetical protein
MEEAERLLHVESEDPSKEIRQAIGCLEEAIKVDPKNPDSQRIYSILGNYIGRRKKIEINVEHLCARGSEFMTEECINSKNDGMQLGFTTLSDGELWGYIKVK